MLGRKTRGWHVPVKNPERTSNPRWKLAFAGRIEASQNALLPTPGAAPLAPVEEAGWRRGPFDGRALVAVPALAFGVVADLPVVGWTEGCRVAHGLGQT